MAARSFAGDSGGTARLGKRIFVGDSGGTARLVKRIFVGDSGGNARLVFQYLQPNHTDQSLSDSGAGADNVAYVLQTDGIAYSQRTNVSGNAAVAIESYVIPTTSASLMEVKVDVISGSVSAGSSATGSFISLGSSQRMWQVTQIGSGNNAASMNVTIREIGNPSNTLTRSVALSATAS